MRSVGFGAHWYAGLCRLCVSFFLLGLTPILAQQPPPNPIPAQGPGASPAPTIPVTATLDAPRDYVIGPQDLLLITILESPELSREVRVNSDGTVNLPLLERIRLQGLTLSQAEDLLQKKYREAGILNTPNITISVKELQSKPVTVMGAVRMQGVIQVNGQSRLLRVLSQAGGITEDAGTVVQVIRAGATSEEQVLRIPIEQVRAGALEANIPVYGGDTVNVIPAGAIYVVGAVNRPGRHLMSGDSDQLTILRALALAEDLKRTARPDRAVLIRKNADGQLEQIPVNIRKILQQRGPDVAVLANDVLYVPDSLSKRAFARGLEAAVQIATGMAMFGIR